MSNEILALFFALLYLGLALGAYKLGKVWLQAFLALSYVLTMTITNKFFDFYGVAASAGIMTYAGIFFATDMMTERYGKEVGYQTVRVGFGVAVVYVMVIQMTLLFNELPFSQAYAQAMEGVYGTQLRAMVAGFSIYLVAQHFDVWLYDKIHQWTGDRYLWLRNNGSTIVSQALDTVLFFTLAFYGTMPNAQLVEVIIVCFALKAAIALLDTPFMYLARRLRPLDTKNI